jgi:dihydropteroate synthase
MGIVNINDDSFCGDGSTEVGRAMEMVCGQIAAGADIIDLGAESARTNRGAVSVEEEVVRLRGVLDRWEEAVAASRPRDEVQVWPPVVSVNTWRPEVVAAVMGGGKVELLNDIGGLPDARNAALCAAHGCALVVMHTVGEPKVPHLHVRWRDVVGEMESFFREKTALALACGLARESLILDPGLDFAKQCDDNLRVMRELGRLAALGRPVLAPVSRKTFLGEVLGRVDPLELDAGTVACVVLAAAAGAGLVRVHDTDAAWQALRVADEIL